MTQFILTHGGSISLGIFIIWVIVFVYEIYAEYSKRKEVHEVYRGLKSIAERKKRAVEEKWNNKTWFIKTLKSSLVNSALPIIALSISLLSFVSAEKANLLTEYQLLPQFEVDLEYHDANTTSSSVDLIIKTSDSSCTGFDIKVLTFAETIVTQNSITKHYLIPLDGYFDVHVPVGNCSVKLTDHATTTNGMGGIYAFGDPNQARLNSLNGQLSYVAYQRNVLAHIFPPSHFIKIEYQDRLGKRRVEYRQISLQFTGKILETNWSYASQLHEQRKHINLASGAEEILSYVDSQSPDRQYPQNNEK